MVHVAPLSPLGTQPVPEHLKPVAQSVLLAQDVLQAVAPHAYGLHALFTGTLHAPEPLHVAASDCSFLTLSQLAALHTVDGPAYTQPSRLLPSHEDPHVVPYAAHAGREPTGAPDAALHVPTLPAMLHASHCPVQVVSQHTPSTQFHDAHSAPALQAVPLASGLKSSAPA
jgi:hypothetical protein